MSKEEIVSGKETEGGLYSNEWFRNRALRTKAHPWLVPVSLALLVVVAGTLFLGASRSDVRLEEARQHVDDPGAIYWEAPKRPVAAPEEAVIVASSTGAQEILPLKEVLFEYIEVVDGCAEHFEGECVNVRSGPGAEFPVVARLRNHVILKVGGKVEREGRSWFKIVFDEPLLYPERVRGDWYVAADYVRVVLNEGDKTIWDHEAASTTKRIVVDRSDQTLTAYDGDEVFMEMVISTGLELTPTPRGTFSVFKKTPSRYMQGPLPGLPYDYYDLPGVPWNLYFTHEGAVIHGAYWHNSFGSRYSHGCVNLPPDEAKKLYDWAVLGTTVIVQD